MTIIYQYRVASTSLGGFLKLLRAWKGSVYKLLYKELIIFVSMYAAISLIYRFALTEDQKLVFEVVVLELFNASSAIPLSFVLGFYVTFIVQRWWQQFNNVPWPDRTLFLMSAYLHGFDDRARMMRRSVARYMMFGLIWICRAISLSVMKRFPTLDHIVDAGFITKEEKVMFENTECKYQKFFVPLMWANQILVTARRENKIETEFGLRMVIEIAGSLPLRQMHSDFKGNPQLFHSYDMLVGEAAIGTHSRPIRRPPPSRYEMLLVAFDYYYNNIPIAFYFIRLILSLADFRDKCSLCFVYDWITVPLVYTQVVTFAVYSYFAVSLFGQQYLDPAKNYKGFEMDFYIPGFTILQFLFYMGWLKVAEQMINPFGEDDDDFDINWLLDRHTAVAFALVDQCYGKYPSLVRDGFWNDVAPDIPYTESSARFMRPNFLGSTFNIEPTTQRSENLFIRDHDDVNQHAWLQRNRRKPSISGSLLSLYPFKTSRNQGDSQTTLGSSGSGYGRHMPNGKVYYYVLDKDQEKASRTRWSSVEIPVSDSVSDDGSDTFQVRERANTDSDFREYNGKERKLSLPFIINPFSKNKQKKMEPAPTSGSPKVTRFTVESVKEVPAPETETNSANKARRSGHASIPFQNVVSRIPMLSAISESNTITSLSPATWGTDAEFDFNENTLNGFLPYGDNDKEDGLSYVDEFTTTNEDKAQSPAKNTNNKNPASVTFSPLKAPSTPPATQTEAPTTSTQPQLAPSKDRKISMSSFFSRLPQKSVIPVDKSSLPLKSAMKDTTSSSPSKVAVQTITSTSPSKMAVQTAVSTSSSKVSMQTTKSASASKDATMQTTTSNGPLLAPLKKNPDIKDSHQSNQNSVKTSSKDKASLAPLIAFEDC